MTISHHPGFRLQLLRTYHGYKQAYLADRMGISQRAYSKLERGEINWSPAHAHRAAAVLEAPEEWFVQAEEFITLPPHFWKRNKVVLRLRASVQGAGNRCPVTDNLYFQ